MQVGCKLRGAEHAFRAVRAEPLFNWDVEKRWCETFAVEAEITAIAKQEAVFVITAAADLAVS